MIAAVSRVWPIRGDPQMAPGRGRVGECRACSRQTGTGLQPTCARAELCRRARPACRARSACGHGRSAVVRCRSRRSQRLRGRRRGAGASGATCGTGAFPYVARRAPREGAARFCAAPRVTETRHGHIGRVWRAMLAARAWILPCGRRECHVVALLPTLRLGDRAPLPRASGVILAPLIALRVPTGVDGSTSGAGGAPRARRGRCAATRLF